MKLYIGVNKNGSVALHTVEPIRTSDSWVSKKPYINSHVYDSISDMVKHSTMNWTEEPEIIEINVFNNK